MEEKGEKKWSTEVVQARLDGDWINTRWLMSERERKERQEEG
jgi:hypothetical protein